MPNLHLIIDREELTERVSNLGVAYAAIAATGISAEEQADITDDLDEAFVEGLVTHTELQDETLDAPAQATELVGYLVTLKETGKLETSTVFANETYAQQYLDNWKHISSHKNYEITPIYRETP